MLQHGQPKFEYLESDATPSEAGGTYGRKQFYFYARFNCWEFAANDIGLSDPCSMLDIHRYSPDSREKIFTEKYLCDFELTSVIEEGNYENNEFSASYMPEQEMRRLINNCLAILDQSQDRRLTP